MPRPWLPLTLALGGCDPLYTAELTFVVPADLLGPFDDAHRGQVLSTADQLLHTEAILCEPSDEELRLEHDLGGIGCGRRTRYTVWVEPLRFPYDTQGNPIGCGEDQVQLEGPAAPPADAPRAQGVLFAVDERCPEHDELVLVLGGP